MSAEAAARGYVGAIQLAYCLHCVTYLTLAAFVVNSNWLGINGIWNGIHGSWHFKHATVLFYELLLCCFSV